MNSQQKNVYLTRANVLAMLNDDEIASVSTAETAERLGDGDEYLDLEHLDRGVCRARSASTSMGSVLPRKSVPPPTWTKLIACLAAPAA
jgi:hypothetical protein